MEEDSPKCVSSEILYWIPFNNGLRKQLPFNNG